MERIYNKFETTADKEGVFSHILEEHLTQKKMICILYEGIYLSIYELVSGIRPGQNLIGTRDSFHRKLILFSYLKEMKFMDGTYLC